MIAVRLIGFHFMKKSFFEHPVLFLAMNETGLIFYDFVIEFDPINLARISKIHKYIIISRIHRYYHNYFLLDLSKIFSLPCQI